MEKVYIFALAIKEKQFLQKLQGGLPEWLTEQFAKLSTRKCRMSSNLIPSATENSGCSVVRSSRLVWDQEVAGSNPATPTNSKNSAEFF